MILTTFLQAFPKALTRSFPDFPDYWDTHIFTFSQVVKLWATKLGNTWKKVVELCMILTTFQQALPKSLTRFFPDFLITETPIFLQAISQVEKFRETK